MTTLRIECARLSSGPQAATRSHRRGGRAPAVRVDQDLVRVEPVPLAVEVLRAVDAVGVAHPGRHPDDVDVPEVEGPVDVGVEPDRLDRRAASRGARRSAARPSSRAGRTARSSCPRRPGVAPSGCGRPGRTVNRRARRARSARSSPSRVRHPAIGGSSSTRFSFACLRIERDDRASVPGQRQSLRLAVEERAAPRPRRHGPPRRRPRGSPTRAIDWDLSLSR